MLSNVYVFTGNPFLVQRLRQEWVRRFDEKYGRDGIASYDLSVEGEAERLLQELSMQSFFVTRRLFIVHGNPFAKPVKRGRKKKMTDDETPSSPLLDALFTMDEETIVVFTDDGPPDAWPDTLEASNIRMMSATNGRITGYDPKRSLTYDAFLGHLFDAPIRKEALLQITKSLQEVGRKDEEIDLFAAYHALEQLALLPEHEQTAQLARELLQIVPEERGYELSSMLLTGRTQQAIAIIEGMLRQGMHPRQVFRMLSTQVLDLIKAKTLQHDHPALPESALAAKLGKTPWQAGKIATVAARAHQGQLVALLRALTDLNEEMNSGDIDAEQEGDFIGALTALILRSAAEKGSGGSSNTRPAASTRTVGRPAATRA